VRITVTAHSEQGKGWRVTAGVIAAVEAAALLYLTYAFAHPRASPIAFEDAGFALGGLAAAVVMCATAAVLLRRRAPGRAARAWAALSWLVHVGLFALVAVILVPVGGWSSALQLGAPVLALWAVLVLGTRRIVFPRALTPAAPPAGR
jgi:peptidoglycan biosynthesis protein MviN/MurJ (putative lipid II flippase)